MSIGNYIQKFALLLVLVIVSCKGDDKNIQETSSTEAEKKTPASTPPAPGSMSGDTINLSGKFVLFFGPEVIADPKQNPGTGEIETFRNTSTNVMDSLKSIPHLSMAYSNADYFRIYLAGGSSMVVSKEALKTATGLLVTDGNQPPTIKKGILTSAEYLKLIREYFFIK